MRKIVNTDPSRLKAIKQILKMRKRLIIFYNFNYELEILRGLQTTGICTGEWNGHRKTPVPDGDEWVYLVQYTAGSEGWNCTTTDSVVLYSLTYSYKNYIQCQGRIDRLDTPYTDLYYYILESLSPIDIGVKRALDAKKSFNETKSDLARRIMADNRDFAGLLTD
jgi:superfamily II DNA or RNA helicase